MTILNNLQLEKEQNVEKIGKSEGIRNDNNCANSIDKLDDVDECPETSDKEDSMENIHFHTISETIPEEFRLDASDYFLNHDIAETLSTKIIPHWNQEQRAEAIQQVLAGDHAGSYAEILIKLFKVKEHIDCTRSHKQFIEKTFYRFQSVFKHLEEKTILAHDQSKLRY